MGFVFLATGACRVRIVDDRVPAVFLGELLCTRKSGVCMATADRA